MDDARILEATRQKLQGHLVSTPLIGALSLPGFSCRPDLRIKAENLQTGGGLWFRGAMCELGRHLGALKGVVLTGGLREAFGAACAAQLQRCPAVAVVAATGLDAHWRGLFDAVDCEVVAVASGPLAAGVDREARARGFAVLPGVEAEQYARGVATVGLELAETLPSHASAVYLTPPELAPAVERGLRAGGSSASVVAVEAGAPDAVAGLVAALRAGVRIECDPESAHALAAARASEAGPDVCVLLTS